MNQRENDTLVSALPIIEAASVSSLPHLNITVLVASYNTVLAQGLVDGCLEYLTAHDITPRLIRTDGAFELPLLAKKEATNADAVICLGAVVKGDTAHFDYVAGECARGLQTVMLDTMTPIVFGVLTTYTLDQAMVRAQNDSLNKGREAAMVAVNMAQLLPLV